MAERWILHPEAALHWRQIDGEWLLYDDLSGGTHLIDPVSAAVLTCFELNAELGMAELLAQLRADLDLNLAFDQAATVVQQFRMLGLLVLANSQPSLHAAG